MSQLIVELTGDPTANTVSRLKWLALGRTPIIISGRKYDDLKVFDDKKHVIITDDFQVYHGDRQILGVTRDGAIEKGIKMLDVTT